MIRKRNYHGFVQYHVDGKWIFNVTGFGSLHSPHDGFCNVQTYDGRKERVQIDANDRIQIAGKWFSRRYWNH